MVANSPRMIFVEMARDDELTCFITAPEVKALLEAKKEAEAKVKVVATVTSSARAWVSFTC